MMKRIARSISIARNLVADNTDVHLSVFLFCLALLIMLAVMARAEAEVVAEVPSASDEVEEYKMPPVKVMNLQEALKALEKQKGSVVVVNFWATWCAPCVEEMPELIEFHKKFAPREVKFISYSADHPDGLDDRIIPVVKQTRITFPVYVVGGEQPDELVKAFDEKWQGSLPATFVYDAEGKKQKAWFRKISLEELKQAVEPLLPKEESSSQEE